MNATEIASALAIYFKGQNITQDVIAKQLGVTQQYVSGLLTGRNKFGKKQANRFSQLYGINPVFLLTGEGEMLKGQTAIGDHNTQVAGNSNSVNCSGPLDKALDEIAAQRRLVAKSQEQIDRLLGIVEKLSTPGPKQG